MRRYSYAQVLSGLQAKNPNASIAAVHMLQKCHDALELIEYYYNTWDPEQPLHESWPRDAKGEPLSPQMIMRQALDFEPLVHMF